MPHGMTVGAKSSSHAGRMNFSPFLMTLQDRSNMFGLGIAPAGRCQRRKKLGIEAIEAGVIHLARETLQRLLPISQATDQGLLQVFAQLIHLALLLSASSALSRPLCRVRLPHISVRGRDRRDEIRFAQAERLLDIPPSSQ